MDVLWITYVCKTGGPYDTAPAKGSPIFPILLHFGPFYPAVLSVNFIYRTPIKFCKQKLRELFFASYSNLLIVRSECPAGLENVVRVNIAALVKQRLFLWRLYTIRIFL